MKTASQLPMTFSETWSLRKCGAHWRWYRAALAVLCVIATLLNGIKVSFQGNGDPSWSGLFIGVALGLAWSFCSFLDSRNSHAAFG